MFLSHECNSIGQNVKILENFKIGIAPKTAYFLERLIYIQSSLSQTRIVL